MRTDSRVELSFEGSPVAPGVPLWKNGIKEGSIVDAVVVVMDEASKRIRLALKAAEAEGKGRLVLWGPRQWLDEPTYNWTPEEQSDENHLPVALGDEHVELLASEIEQSGKITSLELQGNEIGDDGFERLARRSHTLPPSNTCTCSATRWATVAHAP